MRQCAIHMLRPGMVLARPVYDRHFRLLLGQSVELSVAFIEKLKAMDYKYVYINENGTENIVPEEIVDIKDKKSVYEAFDEYTAEAVARDKGAHGKQKSSTMMRSLRKSSGQTMLMRRASEKLLSSLTNNSVRFYYPTSMQTTGSGFNHSFDVAMLSSMIGQRLYYSVSELNKLSQAAMLHDIGKSLLEDDIDKIHPADRTEEQEKEYRQHPILGGDILMDDRQIDPATIVGIQQHHERYDGSGFPDGLVGDPEAPHENRKSHGTIFRYADIIAVANYFDNLVNARIEREPVSPIEAVGRLIKLSGTWFHPAVVKEAISIINVFPVGTNVMVEQATNMDIVGYRGVVARVNPENLHRPEILLLYDKNLKRLERPFLMDFASDRYSRLAFIEGL